MYFLLYPQFDLYISSILFPSIVILEDLREKIHRENPGGIRAIFYGWLRIETNFLKVNKLTPARQMRQSRVHYFFEFLSYTQHRHTYARFARIKRTQVSSHGSEVIHHARSYRRCVDTWNRSRFRQRNKLYRYRFK